ncbi:hypothetical protein M885DRAFT_178663 [Pelagophyceae sp. CCMP2097]|nr:hypothetical protein M885DRAFT_178663 [Pelagophyceae sp. CCMP2097]
MRLSRRWLVALAARARAGALLERFETRWDPPALSPSWFASFRAEGAKAPVCSSLTAAVTARGTYGRLNNGLRELAVLLQFASTRSPPLVVIVPPSVLSVLPRDRFDYVMAVEGWGCLDFEGRKGLDLQTADIKDVFYADVQYSVQSGLKSIIVKRARVDTAMPQRKPPREGPLNAVERGLERDALQGARSLVKAKKGPRTGPSRGPL